MWRSQLGEALLRAALLAFELVAGMGEPLQGGRRRGLGLAQPRQRVGGDGLRGRGPGLLLLGVRDGLEVVLRLRLRRPPPARGPPRSRSRIAAPRGAGSRPRGSCSGSPAGPASSGESTWAPISRSTSSTRTRLSSAALRRSSASWRRACRPAMPAASSRMRRRDCGLALMISLIWPCRTRAGERAPVAASANRICTSRARTSLPLTR